MNSSVPSTALRKGAVLISPEFVCAKKAQVLGCINFLVPVKWGIEITRDGSKLDEHCSRFDNAGAYRAWLTAGDMTDYILLDFCTTTPIKSHPRERFVF